MSLPVLFTMCCIVSALVGYYKGRARKKEQELLTVWIEENHETSKYPLSSIASSLADLHSLVGLFSWVGWGPGWRCVGAESVAGHYDLPYPPAHYHHNVLLPLWLWQGGARKRTNLRRVESSTKTEKDFQADNVTCDRQEAEECVLRKSQ